MAVVITFSTAFGQVLWSDNFNSYPNGNAEGQGGWSRDGATAAQAQIGDVTPATHGKSLRFVRTDIDPMWIYKALPWASRNPANNILQVNFSLYTGSTPGTTAMQIYAGGSGYFVVGTIAYDGATGAIAYNNDTLPAAATLLPVATANTWYDCILYYDAASGSSNVSINGVSFGPFAGTAGKSPDELDFLSGGSATLASAVDNVQVSALAVLGTAEVAASESLQIYPNPASDFVYVKSENSVEQVVLFDMAGKLVRKTVLREDAFDVKSLSAGVYVMQVKFKDGTTESRRIVKK